MNKGLINSALLSGHNGIAQAMLIVVAKVAAGQDTTSALNDVGRLLHGHLSSDGGVPASERPTSIQDTLDALAALV